MIRVVVVSRETNKRLEKNNINNQKQESQEMHCCSQSS